MSLINNSLLLITSAKGGLHRWWQGLGFGIQSRTDYEYLKEVIKEDLPYYAYSELPDKQSQLIYRICLHAHNGKIALVGQFTPTERKAASLATHGKAEVFSSASDSKFSIKLYDTIITKDSSILSSPPYGSELARLSTYRSARAGGARGGPVTWDIKGRLCIIQHLPDRYPEHYCI